MTTEAVTSSLDLRLREPGDHPVDVPIICVITRFGLRSARYLLPTYLDYLRVVREAKKTQTPGLLRAAFLIENLKTCYSLSIWASYDAIPRFGTNVLYHVVAGNKIFGRLAKRDDGYPELWSNKWQLTSVSHNLNWENFDLRGLILALESERRQHA